MIATTLPNGVITHTAYDAVGNKVASTDAAGHTTTFAYDAVNRLVSAKSPLGETTTTAYDPAGNPKTKTDPRGKVTTFAYDAGNRPIVITDPLGGQTKTSYDRAGHVVSVTDADGHVTTYAYDADGRKTTVTAPDGGVTAIAYDAGGNVVQRTDPLGHVSTVTYDADGRSTSATDAIGRTTTYGYDAAGRITTVVDPNNVTSTHHYDVDGRETGMTYSDGTPAVSYTYDAAGNTTTATGGAGATTYTYDSANRVLTRTTGSDTFSYTYDADGSVATRTYPGGATTSYTYDADERMATATVGSATTTFQYNASGLLTAKVLPNGWTETRTYDAAGRVASIASGNGTTTIASSTYTRDAVGNPTRIVRDGVTENYTFDPSNRTTAVCYGGPVTSCSGSQLITYTYDKNGNRTTQTNFGTLTTYLYDAGDELTSSATSGVPTTNAYDSDGNEVRSGTTTYTFDGADHLTSVSNGLSPVASYTYDAKDNRVTKTANGQTTTYRWDENNALPQLAAEESGGSITRSYFYGTSLLSLTTGSSSYYVHVDDLGSVVGLTSASGAVETTTTYDPFGVTRQTTKVDPHAPDNPMQFAGQLVDSETGLYDLRARTYDPSTGRMLSTDPKPATGSDAGVSPYSYAADSSMTESDPSGETACSSLYYQYCYTNGQNCPGGYDANGSCLGGATNPTPAVTCPAGQTFDIYENAGCIDLPPDVGDPPATTPPCSNCDTTGLKPLPPPKKFSKSLRLFHDNGTMWAGLVMSAGVEWQLACSDAQSRYGLMSTEADPWCGVVTVDTSNVVDGRPPAPRNANFQMTEAADQFGFNTKNPGTTTRYGLGAAAEILITQGWMANTAAMQGTATWVDHLLIEADDWGRLDASADSQCAVVTLKDLPNDPPASARDPRDGGDPYGAPEKPYGQDAVKNARKAVQQQVSAEHDALEQVAGVCGGAGWELAAPPKKR